MKPYYQDEWVTIYLGDCREILPELPKCDAIIADPPYNVGQKFANDNLGQGDYLDFMRSWISLAYDRLADNSSFYMFHYFLGMWDIKPILDSFDWRFLNLIIWAYPNLIPSNKAMKVRYPLSYQPIFYYGKNITRDLVGKLWDLGIDERKDVWLKTATQSNFEDEYRWHPSCKPQAVISKIIIGATEPNELIIDPFLGSGTTACCAKKLNRKCIGIEIEEKYCEIAADRCRQMVMKLDV